MTKKELYSQVFRHINSVSEFRSPELWKEIIELCPQYKVTCKAFKAVCEEPRLNMAITASPFKSWSKSLNGIEAYLQCGEYYDIDSDSGFFLLEAEITAFDLSSLIIDLKNQGFDVPAHILRMGKQEEELISLEIHSLKKPRITSWFELFY